ncbi:hypothetical protein Bca52824_027810 [Brassica carinata]|uniref:Uncharacterized protein n=1 Tax=Brassica carinata TaxID=52824 RepID=A0A8X8ANS9_BRACI|nr:hypothetical protein Bca52824_027810 [Brassica carinata]
MLSSPSMRILLVKARDLNSQEPSRHKLVISSRACPRIELCVFWCGSCHDWSERGLVAEEVKVECFVVNLGSLYPPKLGSKLRKELIIGSLKALGASPGTLTDPNPDFPSGSTPSDLAYANGYKGITAYLSEYALRTHVSLLSLNEKNSETSLAAVETAPSPSSSALTDSLTAVRNASRAWLGFIRFSGLKRALSMLAPKTHKQGRAHNDDSVQAAAIWIQNKFRGYKGRKDYLITPQRIIKIQAHVRGYQVRKKYRKIIWSVGILEKVILRWRRKGAGLRGIKSDALVTKMQDGTEKEEEDDFFKQGRKQTEERLEKALARVKSMVQYPEARDQYRRLLNVVNDILESKVEKALANSEEATCFDDDLIDIEALLGDDDTLMIPMSSTWNI